MEYEKLLDNLYASLPKKKESANPTGERFEVPAVEVFIAGTKTSIKNFDAITAKLRRKPEELAKFLYRELAAPGVVHAGQLVLQGKLSSRLINDKIAVYTSTHVICPQCRKPDTHIDASGRHLKTLICEACGARTPIRD